MKLKYDCGCMTEDVKGRIKVKPCIDHVNQEVYFAQIHESNARGGQE